MPLLVVALALFATACGGGGGQSSEEISAALAEAEANQNDLELTGNVAESELLDAATGEIKSLSDVVVGDRPVLVWYWAPH